LKCELFDQQPGGRFASHHQAKLAIFDYLEANYTRYLAGGPRSGGRGRRAGYDLLPLSLMIRGVLSPGLVALADR
jgi:hypothetical protein